MEPCEVRSLPDDELEETQPVLLLLLPVQTMLRVKQMPMISTKRPTTIVAHPTAKTEGPKACVKKAHFRLKPMINQMNPASAVKKPQ